MGGGKALGSLCLASLFDTFLLNMQIFTGKLSLQGVRQFDAEYEHIICIGLQ